MIDKQKLLQFIEDQKYVFAPMDNDSAEEEATCKGALRALNMIERGIELGWFDA